MSDAAAQMTEAVDEKRPPPTDRFISKSEYARWRGVAPATVSQYGREDRLVLNADSKVDWKATDRLLDQSLDPNRGGDRTGNTRKKNRSSAGADYQEAKTQEALARAAKTALEVAEMSRQLVKADEVEAEAFALARQAQETLRAMPDRLAPLLTAETDPAKIHKLLEDEVVRICTMFGGDDDSDAAND